VSAAPAPPPPVAGQLVLADGEVFEGDLVGHVPDDPAVAAVGEVVFNTSLSGYQEILTDPSYAGQIVTFTYPHIGNYGVNGDDDESAVPRCRGMIVRDLSRTPSNWRSEGTLAGYLARHRIAGLAGLDTRRLTRHLRDAGAVPGAFGTAGEATLRAAARADGGTDGCDLATAVSTPAPYVVGPADAARFLVAYDYGIKRTILRHLVRVGCRVEVVPASTPAADALARRPDGVFLSNGPGDPAAVAGAPETIRELMGAVPVFGICLGHQLMGLALGGSTFKLPFGHHGGNHPVQHLESGRVEVTSQNHNYAVRDDSLSGIAVVTHRNLNDGTVEGLRVRDARAASVQYHPEAGPGPHDAAYLFDELVDLVDGARDRHRHGGG
jgi:carbamoyl-phosphate synthase small subunit